MAWGCLLLLYKNYIVYRSVYMFVWSELEFAITSPSFVAPLLLVSEIAKYIAWGCLLLFYKNYIVYYNVDCYYLVCSLKSMCIPSFILIGCCVSELHGHSCPYCNVWPEAVYCCFTRTTMFTELFTYLYGQSKRSLSQHYDSLHYTFQFLR